MPTQQYREWTGVNWSTLKNLLQSPLNYWHSLLVPVTPTPAMEFGTNVHTAILEFAEFNRRRVTIPLEHMTASGGISTAKATKEWRATLDPEAILLTSAQLNTICQIVEMVSNHKPASDWLRRAKHREIGMRWTDETGADCKACPDAFGDGLLLDVKTWAPRGAFTADAFVRDAIGRHYLGQLGFYAKALAANGHPVSQMGFIVVQSTAPHDVMVLELDVDAVDYAFEEANNALALLVEYSAMERKHVGAEPELVTVSLPPRVARGRAGMVDFDAGF